MIATDLNWDSKRAQMNKSPDKPRMKKSAETAIRCVLRNIYTVYIDFIFVRVCCSLIVRLASLDKYFCVVEKIAK